MDRRGRHEGATSGRREDGGGPLPAGGVRRYRAVSCTSDGMSDGIRVGFKKCLYSAIFCNRSRYILLSMQSSPVVTNIVNISYIIISYNMVT